MKAIPDLIAGPRDQDRVENVGTLRTSKEWHLVFEGDVVGVGSEIQRSQRQCSAEGVPMLQEEREIPY